jgi:hypothetical protein
MRHRIPKGLTIGHDNYADLSTEAQFNKIMASPKDRPLFESIFNNGRGRMSDATYEEALKEYVRNLSENTVVLGVCPNVCTSTF